MGLNFDEIDESLVCNNGWATEYRVASFGSFEDLIEYAIFIYDTPTNLNSYYDGTTNAIQSRVLEHELMVSGLDALLLGILGDGDEQKQIQSILYDDDW